MTREILDQIGIVVVGALLINSTSNYVYEDPSQNISNWKLRMIGNKLPSYRLYFGRIIVYLLDPINFSEKLSQIMHEKNTK